MTLAKKIGELLKDELKPENIKTVIDMAEFLKFKENQSLRNMINESENEYISEEEHLKIKEIKQHGEFIEQDDLSTKATDIEALRKWNKISKDIQNRILQNVFCSTCGVTTIIDYSITEERSGIIGKCKKYNKPVARLIEE